MLFALKTTDRSRRSLAPPLLNVKVYRALRYAEQQILDRFSDIFALFFRLIELIWSRKTARPDFCRHIRDAALFNLFRNIVITLNEPGCPFKHTKHVFGHQNLPVALRRSSNPDCDRNINTFWWHFNSDRLQHALRATMAKAPASARPPCASDDEFSHALPGITAAAGGVATQCTFISLRCQSDMAHHRNSALGQESSMVSMP